MCVCFHVFVCVFVCVCSQTAHVHRAHSRGAAAQWLTGCFLSVETVKTQSFSGLSCSEISAAASWSEQKLQLVCTELQFLCPPPVWPAPTLCFNISSTKICVTPFYSSWVSDPGWLTMAKSKKRKVFSCMFYLFQSELVLLLYISHKCGEDSNRPA